jgi:APA family basic amino acid/polyamine antiporter
MGVVTATSLVVSSMIGTGVFTAAGFVAGYIPSAIGGLVCWVVAGLAALSGALAYAELGAAYAESGGEYLFLSRLVHPSVGFLSAFVSLIVGFSAPLAAIAIAFGEYLSVFVPSVPPKASGALLIVLMSLLNVRSVTLGARFQNGTTFGKIALILLFVILGAVSADATHLSGGAPLAEVLPTSGFALGLLFVSFSYTGWQAAIYVAGEVTEPARVLPRALVGGTLVVTLLYVALNAVFLAAAPLDALTGEVKVGHIAAGHLFGEGGAKLLSAVIAIGLVSTVGAIAITGPRVYEAVGRDFPALAILAARRPGEGPRNAVAIQGVLALAMLFITRFRELMVYMGFTLSLFSALSVSSLFVLRRRRIERPFSMPGYPLLPILYIALMGWMVVSGIRREPEAALYALGTLVLGLLLYLVANRDGSERGA